MASRKQKWETMNKTERRIAIARDVIANIVSKKIVAQSGTYVNGKRGRTVKIDHNECDEDIACDLMKKCTACALGSMMLTKVAKYNDFAFDTFKDVSEIQRSDTANALENIFSYDELCVIECAFEGKNFAHFRSTTIVPFGDNGHWSGLADAGERLIAIMQNIIDNGGEFNPDDTYEMADE